jgi:hypothetical protein
MPSLASLLLERTEATAVAGHLEAALPPGLRRSVRLGLIGA